MRLIKNPKDFWAGVLYIVFGVGAIAIAYDYPVGSAGRMGPGYFPRGLGIILIVLGLILGFRALKLRGAPLSFPSFKAILIVTGSVVLFGLAAPKLGLMAATVILVIASSTASEEFTWKAAILSSIFLAIFTLAAFAYGLKLQLPIWPWFME